MFSVRQTVVTIRCTAIVCDVSDSGVNRSLKLLVLCDYKVQGAFV